MAETSPGGIAFDTTLPASTGVAAVGVAAAAARRDHVHPSAVTYAGGNTTEATTTSTTTVDILTVSSLSIEAATPFSFLGALRKTSGSADTVRGGIKLNTTVIIDSINLDNALFYLSVVNEPQSGGFNCLIPPRVTNYIRGVTGTFSAAGATGTLYDGITSAMSATIPSVTITDVTVNGRVENALITLGVDDVHVYTLATS